MIKKEIAVLAVLALLCAWCCSVAEVSAQPEILAIYSCPESQIITGADVHMVLL